MSACGRVVHRQHDAGDDLHHQHEREDAAEGPEVVQVARHRVGDRTIEWTSPMIGRRLSSHLRSRSSARRRWNARSWCSPGRLMRSPGSKPSAPAPITDLGVGHERVGRDRQVLRRRAPADAAGGVVVRAVAGAEPAAVVALLAERHAAEMGADAVDHEPLLVALLDARRVGLRVAQGRDVRRPRPPRSPPRCGGARRSACRARTPSRSGLVARSTSIGAPAATVSALGASVATRGVPRAPCRRRPTAPVASSRQRYSSAMASAEMSAKIGSPERMIHVNRDLRPSLPATKHTRLRPRNATGASPATLFLTTVKAGLVQASPGHPRLPFTAQRHGRRDRPLDQGPGRP